MTCNHTSPENEFFKGGYTVKKFILMSLAPLLILLLVLLRVLVGRTSVFLINNKFYGHMALDTELQLNRTKGTIRISAFIQNNSVNKAIEASILDHVKPIPMIIFWPLWRLLISLPKSLRKYLGLIEYNEYREFAFLHLLASGKRYLNLSQTQELEGSILSDIGLTSKNYYCISIRDGSYGKGSRANEHLEEYRNMELDAFFDAINALNNVRFVRIGRTSNHNFSSDNLFDYSQSRIKSDDLDLIILRNSKGLISGGDGIAAVAAVLKIPVFYVRYCPWEIFPNFSSLNLIAPGMLSTTRSGRLLTIHETLSIDRGKGFNWPFPNNPNLSIYNFTDLDILHMLQEFTNQFEGPLWERLVSQTDDMERRFWEAYWRGLPTRFKRNIPMHSKPAGRISRVFLQRYGREILGDS
jgi:putative glycosyltransferase (TIGR04372 family)